MSAVHYHLDGYIAHPNESCSACRETTTLGGGGVIDLRGDIKLNVDPDFEPQGEVFAKGVTVHVERMNKKLWWFRIDQPDGPSLVGHFVSKKPITTNWEWEDA